MENLVLASDALLATARAVLGSGSSVSPTGSYAVLGGVLWVEVVSVDGASQFTCWASFVDGELFTAESLSEVALLEG